MNNLLKNIFLWAAIILAVFVFYRFFQDPSTAPDLMNSAEFTEALRAGKIARVTLHRDATIGGALTEPGPDGKPARFLIATPAYRELVDDLLRQNIAIEFYSPRESSLQTTFLSWLPMLALIGIWIYFMRTIQAARRKPESQPGPPIGP